MALSKGRCKIEAIVKIVICSDMLDLLFIGLEAKRNENDSFFSEL